MLCLFLFEVLHHMKPKLKNVFLAGLAVTVPVGLTIYILIFLIDLMDGHHPSLSFRYLRLS